MVRSSSKSHNGHSSIYWLEPSDEDKDLGVPDTRYAFLELTQPRDIGAFNPSDYDIHYILDTTNLVISPQFRSF